MRADRLVAIVLLLQVHGQRTAGQLAAELETSERTIRRDLDALSASGVPVYAQRGRGGGWSLLGGHRIDLSGLTAPEARSLVLAAAGVPGQDAVDGAVRKVLAALPPPLRDQVQAARAAVHVDTRPWGDRQGTADSSDDGARSVATVRQLRRALDDGVQVDLCYARPGQEPSWRRVHPHGLVVKHGVWYLVGTAAAGLRTYRVSRVVAVETTAEPAVRPIDFDLAAAWDQMQQRLAELRPAATVAVELEVAPRMWPLVLSRLGAWWDVVDLGATAEGWRRAVVAMHDPAHAALELLGFGDAVVVHGPAEVRAHLAALGQRLVDRYTPRGT